jgi:hypothetical protein
MPDVTKLAACSAEMLSLVMCKLFGGR